MTISKDRVKPSPMPDSWKLNEIFSTGVVLGGYQALMTVVFFWAMHDTDFFSVWFLMHSMISSLQIFCITISFGVAIIGQIWCEEY